MSVFLFGFGSKRCQPLGTTGFSLFFRLPIGFFRYPVFLTHSHLLLIPKPLGALAGHGTEDSLEISTAGTLGVSLRASGGHWKVTAQTDFFIKEVAK